MAEPAVAAPALYDGVAEGALARALGVPRVAAFAAVSSTLDVAHELAAGGAPAGTLVLADAQTAGRGRAGRRWASPAGAGIWLTLVERPDDAEAVGVLSLRLGLQAARVLEPFADGPVRLKWPNDLYVGDRKLAGILVEARWHAGRLDWAAIGFGVNVAAPADVATATGLRPGVARLDVLAALVPALREGAAARGALTPAELEAFAARDLARGRRAVQPGVGTVVGITSAGELRLALDGTETTWRGGSLVFEEER